MYTYIIYTLSTYYL